MLSRPELERYRLLLARERHAGWDRLIAAGRIEVARVDAIHRHIVEMPHSADTARIVEDYLSRAT